MNILTIPTVDGDDLLLNMPENLNEITLGQLIDLSSGELSNAEVLAIISGRETEEIYGARDITQIDEMARLYIDILSYGIERTDLALIPKKLTLNYKGKPVIVSVKNNLAMQPAGAYYEAARLIKKEMAACIDAHGDHWIENFQPSLQTVGLIMDQFLFARVTSLPYNQKNVLKLSGFSRQVPAACALAIAKYFFNAYPDLGPRKRPGIFIRLF